jgi:hypothetical protein
MVVNTLSNDADKPLFELGNVCGFNLINDFSGLKYVYFGNFAYLTVDAILWRLRKLQTLLLERSNATTNESCAYSSGRPTKNTTFGSSECDL